MTGTIDDVEAWEVLDSRGDPTVRVAVTSGSDRAVFTVPAGASTGTHEAHELRDGDDRFDGRGVRRAVENVTDELAPAVRGHDVTDQRGVDEVLAEADGTASLERLGANAVLGVSGAVLRAGAAVTDQPLYEYVADGREPTMPCPMVNLFSGGLHARGGFELQDVLLVPLGAPDVGSAIERVWDVRRVARDALLDADEQPLVADEGGFAPPVTSIDEALAHAVECVEAAGYDPGADVALALDVAALHFYEPARDVYVLDGGETELDPAEMRARVSEWVSEYPVVSVEDPLAEDEWEEWARLAADLPDGVQLLGDDLIATNRERLVRARDEGAANAVLVKPNQAGTMTRALDVVETAQESGFAPVVSARSGETSDETIADVAVGRGAGQIKIGSLARSERLSKYNRLLGIERRSEFRLASPFR
jgi:enolase